jgi:hypothetical protein
MVRSVDQRSLPALERGRTSWTLPLDAVRLRPGDDLAAVTAAQVRDVVMRLAAAGHWKDGDPDIMVFFDAGYEPARLAWLLRDLPVQVTGRLGTNRVFRMPLPTKTSSNIGVNLLSRSRIRNLKWLARSPRSMSRLRACWAVHAPVG